MNFGCTSELRCLFYFAFRLGGFEWWKDCHAVAWHSLSTLIQNGRHLRILLHIISEKKGYSGVRLRRDAYNKSLCKWGHFEKAKTTFKMLLATWFLVCLFKRFRFFNAKNLGSAGQRAAKLLAVKVGGLKKGLPAGPGPSQPVCPGSMPGRSQIILKVWWLVTLQPFDLQTPNF